MKEKVVLFIVCLFMFVLVGCGVQVNANVENNTETVYTTVGVGSLEEIGNGLWYDKLTNIVYWWNGVLNYSDYATTPSPYYAPNGRPYRYNPNTNTFTYY